MRMNPEPHFDFAQPVADAIDLRVDAKPIQRPAAQLVIQPFPIAQNTRVFPPRLPADAVAHLRVHSREQDVELIKFRAQLAQIGIAIIPVSLPVLIPAARILAPLICFRRSAEARNAEEDQRGYQNGFFHGVRFDAARSAEFKGMEGRPLWRPIIFWDRTEPVPQITFRRRRPGR